jgi:uncharacterized protein with HEPN domain
LPFREPSLLLRDISDAITSIEEFTRGLDFEGFRTDPKTVSAVERKLQLISEAATRLGDQAETLCPGLPWRNIRGIGNWLRHQYDRVDVETIWRTVVDDLPPLHSAVKRALSAPPPNSPARGCTPY